MESDVSFCAMEDPQKYQHHPILILRIPLYWSHCTTYLLKSNALTDLHHTSCATNLIAVRTPIYWTDFHLIYAWNFRKDMSAS